MKSAAAWLAAAAVLLAPPRVQGSCDLVAGRCVCFDEDAEEWDLTSLMGPPVVVGPPQSSLYGDWQYHFDFCSTVPSPPPP